MFGLCSHRYLYVVLLVRMRVVCWHATDCFFLFFCMRATRGKSNASGRGPHQRAMEQPNMSEECPVCMEPYPQDARTESRLGVRSFQCEHALCRTCDGRLRNREDHRCPLCRAPRKGMTTSQAEPPRDRNAPEPDFEDDLGLREFFRPPTIAGPAMAGVAGMGVSMGFGPYGLGSEQLALMRSRGRSRTMFFPSVPPVEAAPPTQHVATDSDDDLLAGAIREMDDWDAARARVRDRERAQRTLEYLDVPREMIDALCDLPGTSNARWQRLRSSHSRRAQS